MIVEECRSWDGICSWLHGQFGFLFLAPVLAVRDGRILLEAPTLPFGYTTPGVSSVLELAWAIS